MGQSYSILSETAGGISRGLPSIVTGIGEDIFHLDAIDDENAMDQIIGYMFKRYGATADIFQQLDSILPNEQEKFYTSAKINVAVKYPRDQIKIILAADKPQ